MLWGQVLRFHEEFCTRIPFIYILYTIYYHTWSSIRVERHFIFYSADKSFIKTINYLFGYKLQLIIRIVSEGQRKANFEECDAKIRESNDKTVNLKKDIKNLLSKYAKIINVSFCIFQLKLTITISSTLLIIHCSFSQNEEAAEKVLPVSRESSACIKRRGLREAISRADEENVRLRKKLDLVKYKSNKVLIKSVFFCFLIKLQKKKK